MAVDLAQYPALVHARLTPFGDDGPWAGFATSDLVSLALGGVVMNCGYDPDPAGHYDLPPIAPQAWHSFHIAGEQLVIGIVSALLYRLRSGLGQKVSVAIHEAVAKNTEIDLMSWVMLRQPVLPADLQARARHDHQPVDQLHQGRQVEPVDARRLAGQPPAAAVHGALRAGRGDV